MKLTIDGLEVLWPYDYIYPEQLQYMTKLKASLHGGHCLLEMPTGTGKCWGRGTPLLLYDGRTKPVEEVVEGDRLMGDDGTPRTVLPGSVIHGNTADDAAVPAPTWQMSAVRGDHVADSADSHGLFRCRYVGCAYESECAHERDTHQQASLLHRTLMPAPEPSMHRVTSTDAGRLTWTCNGAHILVLALHVRPWVELRDEWWVVQSWGTHAGSSAQSSVPFAQSLGRFPTQAEAAAFLAGLDWQPLVFECSVDDYHHLIRDTHMKASLQMYQPSAGVSFSPPEAPLRTRLEKAFGRDVSEEESLMSAWVLGLWLSEGSTRHPAHSHTVVIRALETWCEKMYGRVPVSTSLPPAAATVLVTQVGEDLMPHDEVDVTPRVGASLDQIAPDKESSVGSTVYGIPLGGAWRRLLTSYDLLSHKHFPAELLRDSSSVRSAVLSGVVDADGHLSKRDQCSYEVSAKEHAFAVGLVHLCRGLGLRTGELLKAQCVVEETGDVFDGRRVHISGRRLAEVIHPRLAYKQCPSKQGAELGRDPSEEAVADACGGFTIEPIGHGEYFGFTVDGNGRMLLGDFVVTHNTVSLLSLILSWQYAHPDAAKLTRTVQEMDKVVEELRRVVAYRVKVVGQQIASEVAKGNAAHGLRAPEILGVCLSSRRNLCIHPVVSKHDNRGKVDALCRNKTASFVREQKASGMDVEVCSFYEGYEREGKEATITGIYAIADLRALGQQKGWCPYFTSRRLVSLANVVVYNYQYMLDPKISGMVSRDIAKESIIVFDEAHNIDNICIEALSCEIDKRMVQAASANVNKLQHAVVRMEKTDSKRLQDEYKNLVEGLSSSFGGMGDRDLGGGGGGGGASAASSSARGDSAAETDMLLASPVLPSDLLRESVPGNIRRANHFLMFLRSWVEFLRRQLRQPQVSQKSTEAFLEELRVDTKISDLRAMKFAYDRLQSLYKTLQITDMDDFNPLTAVVNLATMAAMYKEGFTIIFEPFDERTPSIPDPKLQLCCLEASYAIKPVFERFRSVIITSGTLSPLDVYPKMLAFRPVIAESFTMSLSRNCICPMICTKGSDQVPITSSYDLRSDVGVLQNYGRLLIDLSASIPDGLVCFFTSYSYMEDLVSAWKDMGILDEILKYKLIFIETKDVVETTLALDAFKRACDRGRGAVFLSVARGKVAEGIDFDRHYGRAVVMFGIPFQYTLSRVLRARLTYLREKHAMSEQDFLSFDALRQTAQCVGRVIRSKMDYGLMLFADQRFNRSDKRAKLPAWIVQYLDKAHMNLSTDRALTVAKEFLKQMAQPRSHKEELGTTMLDEQTVHRMMRAQQQAKEAAAEEEQKEGQKNLARPNQTMFPMTTTIPGIPHAAPVPWTHAHANTINMQTAAAAAAAAASSSAASSQVKKLGAEPMDIDP